MAFSIGKNSTAEDSASAGFKLSADAESKQVYIGSGTVIEGAFSFDGPTTVNCKLIGNVVAKSSFAVGPEGEVQGSITAAEIIIAGRVVGDIDAATKISLKKPASIQGNIKSPKVSVEDGVVFNGQVVMKSPGEVLNLNREATL